MTGKRKRRDSKWISYVSPDQSVKRVARRILEARLRAVGYWLPCAAERADEDVEFVHQLRVATRRAASALRMFRPLIGKRGSAEVRAVLRSIRTAAGTARDLDVIDHQFQTHSGGVAPQLIAKWRAELERRRQQAQQSIVAVYDELPIEKYDALVDMLLTQVGSRKRAIAKRRFGNQVDQYLKPALTRTFGAFAGDLAVPEQMHQLRIEAKKLRYTIELVEVAYPATLRRKLYPRVVAIQDVLGMANDHIVAKNMLESWALETEDGKLRVFVQGIGVGLSKGSADLRSAFLLTWTPRMVARLRQRFIKCCGFDF